jgi:hypothetical protein
MNELLNLLDFCESAIELVACPRDHLHGTGFLWHPADTDTRRSRPSLVGVTSLAHTCYVSY